RSPHRRRAGERGSAARLQCWHAGHPVPGRGRGGARLSRRRAPAQGRERATDDTERSPAAVRQPVRTGSGMRLFGWQNERGTAPVARDRLKILLAYERTFQGQPDLLAVLREEIMTVLCRHVTVAPDKVQVRMDRGVPVSTLAIDIEIPTSYGKLKAAGA